MKTAITKHHSLFLNFLLCNIILGLLLFIHVNSNSQLQENATLKSLKSYGFQYTSNEFASPRETKNITLYDIPGAGIAENALPSFNDTEVLTLRAKEVVRVKNLTETESPEREIRTELTESPTKEVLRSNLTKSKEIRKSLKNYQVKEIRKKLRLTISLNEKPTANVTESTSKEVHSNLVVSTAKEIRNRLTGSTAKQVKATNFTESPVRTKLMGSSVKEIRNRLTESPTNQVKATNFREYPARPNSVKEIRNKLTESPTKHVIRTNLPKSSTEKVLANVKQVPMKKEQHKKSLKKGRVNSHVWFKTCTVNMDSMRQNPLFPLWPSARGQPIMPNELESITTVLWSFQRIFGYLYPPVTGFYKFKIFSETMSEFWLSSNSDPRNASLLARNNKNPLLSVLLRSGPLMITSKPIYLHQGKAYYFEMLHSVNNVHRGKVRVHWMLPVNHVYTGIPKTSLSTFLDEENYLQKNVRKLLTSSASLRLRESVLKQPIAYEWKDKTFSGPFEVYSSYTRENFHTIEFADRWKIMSVFDHCEYAPSYTRKRNYQLFEGPDFTHFTDVFPVDDTTDKQWDNYKKSEQERTGNKAIAEHEVIQIVNMFMKAVEEEFPGKYALANVINVERNFDKERGNRFLLELLLREVQTNKIQRLSEYVYRFHKKPAALCKPKGIRWISIAKINAILTAKNQGPWVIYYIENMAKIIHATGDKNVHFIVVDYGNNGVDIAAEFRRNSISQFTIIKKKGKFHKTLAIDEAAKLIRDDHIVFLTDLHLLAPNSIFESVRKHTIQGKMTFTPVVFRLSLCSRPETESLTSSGYWESYGYGVFSTYKSDWKFFGGVNVTGFKYKWGGEDSEMVDRVLTKGLEIERLRLPHFYHFYHDRTGLWEKGK